MPVTIGLNNWRAAHTSKRLAGALRYRGAALFLHTVLLLALVTGATYAGTSNLFAAYVAGAAISWWDSELAHLEERRQEQPANQDGPSSGLPHVSALSGCDIFDHFYSPALRRILQPMFFASIGFSIPVTRMFTGSALWKGIVYAILMAISKILCGAWLIRIHRTSFGFIKRMSRKESEPQTAQKAPEQATESAQGAHRAPLLREDIAAATLPKDTVTDESKQQSIKLTPNTETSPANPISLYPAFIVGCAMVARGEIGFLISAVAQSSGMFDDDEQTGDSDVFLVTTWAIVLCTVLGPLCLGFLVRRLRKLEHEAAASASEGRDARRGILGVWGVR